MNHKYWKLKSGEPESLWIATIDPKTKLVVMLYWWDYNTKTWDRYKAYEEGDRFWEWEEYRLAGWTRRSLTGSELFILAL